MVEVYPFIWFSIAANADDAFANPIRARAVSQRASVTDADSRATMILYKIPK
jgi:hypothetical protein